MTVFVLASDIIASKIGGPKTYEVTSPEGTFRVEGVATSPDPDRKVASDTRVVAEGEHVKFISTNQRRLEEDPAYSNVVAPSLEF